jgi:hypothetical protein
MAERCPICFSEIGEWTDDPIKTVNGVAGATHKGFTYHKYQHIKELQDYYQALEIEHLPENQRTSFSPINNSGKFISDVDYIKELRQSVEKILIANGLTKDEYFNYDSEGNFMGTSQVEWNDVNIEGKKFQIRSIHIEDLRHIILYGWIETWNKAELGEYDATFIVDDNADTHSILVGMNLIGDKEWTGSTEIGIGSELSHMFGRGIMTYSSGFIGTEADKKLRLYAENIDVHSFVNMSAFGTHELIFQYPKPYVSPPIIFKCRYNSRLELSNLNFTAQYYGGDIVVIDPVWSYYGKTYYTYPILVQKLLDMSLGSTLKIKLTAFASDLYLYHGGKPFIEYYKNVGQNLSIPSEAIEWTPDSFNGRYLYEDALLRTPDLTLEEFETWNVDIIRFEIEGSCRTDWAGFTGIGIEIKGYTENAYIKTDFTINDIALRTRSRP